MAAQYLNPLLFTLEVRTLDAESLQDHSFHTSSRATLSSCPSTCSCPEKLQDLQGEPQLRTQPRGLDCSSEQGWQKLGEHSHFRSLFLWLQQQQEETNTALAKFDLFLPPQGQKNLFRGW